MVLLSLPNMRRGVFCSDTITRGPLLQRQAPWAPCPMLCPPQAATVLALLPTSLCLW